MASRGDRWSRFTQPFRTSSDSSKSGQGGVRRSYFSARSSAVSSPFYSATSSIADFVSARSSLAMVGGRAQGRTSTEYGKLVRERGLLLPKENELNWSGEEPGAGQHVEFGPHESIPLEVLHPIGASLTAEVDKVRCRRILLARKSMKCCGRLKLSEAINEVEHLQKLRHAHIVQLIGSYVQGRTFAILIYPVADCDLSKFMDRVTHALAKKSMGIRDYLAILSLGRFFSCLSHALSFIHDSDTKHMDIKPANILVKEHPKYSCGYQVYIADFGISRSFSQLGHSQTDTRIARSPKYCAPEVYQEEKRGRAADIFSMGCVFLEMYTVLHRRTLDDFTDYRSRDGENESFHTNLPRVYEWARLCLDSKPYLATLYQGTTFASTRSDEENITVFLSMVNLTPQERPKARKLLEHFGASSCCGMGPEDLTDEGAVQRYNGDGCSLLECDMGKNVGISVDPIDQQYLTLPTCQYTVRQAASSGHEAVLKLLLGACRIGASGVEAALALAARNGQESAAKLLIRSGVNINAVGEGGGTALHWAALGGHGGVVKLLSEGGADVDGRAEDGSTPLHWAASNGHEKMAELLIVMGADVRGKAKDGSTALHWSASSGHTRVVELLAGGGALLSAGDELGRTALHWAASHGHEQSVELLVEQGVNISGTAVDNSTALHWAALRGHKNVVDLLAKLGADVNGAVKDGSTPLHWAASNGHRGVVELLINKEANINARDGLRHTALHWAVSGGHEQVVELLVKKGADVNGMAVDGSTALHSASLKGDEKGARLLVEMGADANEKAKDGSTALHWAALRGHVKVVELLIEVGAEANGGAEDGSTPLHWAASRGREKVVELLAEKGADVDARDVRGRTALHWAISHGHGKVAESLIKMGVDERAKDLAGNMAQGLALTNLEPKASEMLWREEPDATPKDQWAPAQPAEGSEPQRQRVTVFNAPSRHGAFATHSIAKHKYRSMPLQGLVEEEADSPTAHGFSGLG